MPANHGPGSAVASLASRSKAGTRKTQAQLGGDGARGSRLAADVTSGALPARAARRGSGPAATPPRANAVDSGVAAARRRPRW